MIKIRYECPLCDGWFYEPSSDVTAADRGRTIGELIDSAIWRIHAETEAALREHLVERHTAPIVLAG